MISSVRVVSICWHAIDSLHVFGISLGFEARPTRTYLDRLGTPVRGEVMLKLLS